MNVYLKWGLIVVIVIALCAITLQIIQIRTTLSKYESDDYYKRTMVNNKEVIASFDTFPLKVYELRIDNTVMTKLNGQTFVNILTSNMMYTTNNYTVLIGGKPYTTSYRETSPIFLPILRNIATEQLINDILNGNINYITWGKYVFRVEYDDQLINVSLANNKVIPASSILHTYVLIVYPIPDIDALSALDTTILNKKSFIPNHIIYSFGGSSGNKTTSASLLSDESINGIIHAIGYKIV